jgi:uncharacterized SAM-binding protein YcdF (DUF218 family)
MFAEFQSLIAMFDPAQCLTSGPVDFWTRLSWTVFRWLINPTLVISTLLILAVLPWIVRPLARKRWFTGVSITLLILYLSLTSPPAVIVGDRVLVSFLPPDTGAKADAIVILGRGSDFRQTRVDVATQLWEAQRADLIFSSGRGDTPPTMQMLAEQGIPKQAIDGEPCSRTTEENAQFTAAVLEPQGIQRILLVTDPPHLLRSFLTFRSLGFEVIPHASPLPSHLSLPHKALIVAREYLGIVSYSLRGRFAPREPSAIAAIPTKKQM